ncbi:MAG: class I SAM-dependent methyltransferase [Pyrobaculum sp.]
MEIETFGSRSAAFYNFLVSIKAFDWAYGLALRILKRHLPKGSAVLEIGPGVGALLKMLEKEGYFAVGVDASPPMLYYARRRGAGDAAAGVSFALPAKSERFDGAVALFTVHHWGPHEPSAREVYRALRPGGVFVVIEVDLARMPLVGSHGCTEKCLKEALSPPFQVAIEKKFPLVIAVGKKATL